MIISKTMACGAARDLILTGEIVYLQQDAIYLFPFHLWK